MLAATVRRASGQAWLVTRRPCHAAQRQCTRRTFAEEAKAPAKQEAASSAPPATPAPVVQPVPQATKPRSPFLDRMGAFVAGTAIAATLGYWKLHNDVWDSTMQVENSIANMKQDVVESNSDFRRRLARLEHDMAAVRDEQAARK